MARTWYKRGGGDFLEEGGKKLKRGQKKGKICETSERGKVHYGSFKKEKKNSKKVTLLKKGD